MVFIIRRKLTWFFGFLYSIYGIYYYLFVLKEYPSYIEFTLPIVELFYGDGRGFSTISPNVNYLLNFPLIFYLVYTIIYIVNQTNIVYRGINKIRK
ncbi:MAG: hypothetical protein ACK5B9_13855 [Flavobacteriia bacterium]|jgi:hypothetical protein